MTGMEHTTALRAPHKGFIALVSTMVVGMVLLGLSAEESLSGWYARYNVITAQNKEQANALAEGCADQALAALVANPHFDPVASPPTPAVNGGTCHVDVDTTNLPFVGIKSQGEMQGSYANLAMTINLNDVHVGNTVITPSSGTLAIQTVVKNDNNGTANVGDFSISVPGGSPSSFVAISTTKKVSVPAGSYTVSETGPVGYSTAFSGDCDSNGKGTIAVGEVKTCLLTNDDVPTTITVSVNVINNDGGTKSASSFPVTLDGAAVSQGTAKSVTIGSHMLVAPTDSLYTVSTWQCDDGTTGPASGTNVPIVATNQKYCFVTYDDKPAPLSCADTVMMLDRTISMFNNGNTDIQAERDAAMNLVTQYAGVTPKPMVGIGRFGQGDSCTTSPCGNSADILQHLSTSFGSPALPSSGTATINPASNPGTINGQTAWTAAPNGSLAVNSDDGDSTRYDSPNTNQTEVFKFSSPNIPANATNISVTVYGKVRKTNTGANYPRIRFVAVNGNNNAFSVPLDVTSASYTTASAGVNNPNNGGTWTPNDINSGNLRIGVQHYQNNTSGTAAPRITYMYAVVNYTTMSAPTGFYDSIQNHTTDIGSWTNLAAAMTQGNTELQSAHNGKTKVLILFSDGQNVNQPCSGSCSGGGNTTTYATNAATNAANAVKATANTQLFTIHFGTDTTGRNLIKGFATDASHFFDAPNAAAIGGVFNSIAQLACPAIAGSAPSPTKGNLIIVTRVVNDGAGSLQASDFQITLKDKNGSTQSFSGDQNGVTKSIPVGTYQVTAQANSAYDVSTDINCSSNVPGGISAGETRTCTVTYNDKAAAPPPPDLDINLGSWEEVP